MAADFRRQCRIFVNGLRWLGGLRIASCTTDRSAAGGSIVPEVPFVDCARALWKDYDGIEPGVDRVPLEHARWFASLLAQLTPEQIRRAYEAAGASREEIDGFSKRMMEKIAELQAAVK
jgi:hypothetical protein